MTLFQRRECNLLTQVLRKFFPPILTLLLLAGTLEGLARRGIIQNYVFPAPSEVWGAFCSEWSMIYPAALETFTATILGLMLSLFLGILSAAFLATSRFLRQAFYPYALFFQTVPIISIAPMLVIWFGFGQPTVVASSFITSVFPIIANTLLGLESTDPQLVELFQLHSASKWDYLWKLKIPTALPQIFSGLRISAGLASVGAIVGEFVTGGGLGGVIDAGRVQQRLDLVFAAVLASSFLGLVLLLPINYISWVTLRRWHASEQ